MEPGSKKCMICGKVVPLMRGSICDPCQDNVRREALGREAGARTDAEKELKKHGIQPDQGKPGVKR